MTPLTEEHRAVEAVLMVAESPVEAGLLAELLEVNPAKVAQLCAELAASYEEEGRGFVLVEVAGGYRFQSHPDLAGYVERFVLEGQTARMSGAALETLAIVAYKQPVSRGQITSIRGVNAEGALRTLVQRGYVAEVGRDPGPGQAVLYGTTALFLEKLGLNTVRDLPPLAAFVPGAEIMDVLEQSLRHPNRDSAESGAAAVAEQETDPRGGDAPGVLHLGMLGAPPADTEAGSDDPVVIDEPVIIGSSGDVDEDEEAATAPGQGESSPPAWDSEPADPHRPGSDARADADADADEDDVLDLDEEVEDELALAAVDNLDVASGEFLDDDAEEQPRDDHGEHEGGDRRVIDLDHSWFE
jgi:segregation and condensation protein B